MNFPCVSRSALRIPTIPRLLSSFGGWSTRGVSSCEQQPRKSCPTAMKGNISGHGAALNVIIERHRMPVFLPVACSVRGEPTRETPVRGGRRLAWGILLLAGVCLALTVSAWALVTAPLLPEPGPRMSEQTVSPARLEAHVRALSERFVPRHYERTDNLDRAAAYVRAELGQAGASVSEQAYDAGGRTYRNVVAVLGPDTPERIVVGAHYDAAGPYPGADDNASGVAGLIELAHLLGRSRLPMRVELVAYPLEEPPYFRTRYMGSAVHAASLRERGVRVRAMLSLEMIGYFTDSPGSQQFPMAILRAFYPTRGNFITVAGKLGQGLLVRRVKRAMRGASPLPVSSINAPSFVPGMDFSDHLNYWEAGYPAVMITDTAFYRNPFYHSARDTADTLDYARMAMVVQGVHAAVLALAH